MALAIVAWLTFLAHAYVSGHFASLISSAGDITQSASANVVSRVQGSNGHPEYRAISRQLVLFCVERRKAWRMLQSKAGIENREYKAQRALLADVEAGKIALSEFFAHAEQLLKERMPGAPAHKPAEPRPRPAGAAAAAVGSTAPPHGAVHA